MMNIETILYPLHDTHLRDDLSQAGELCRKEHKHLTALIFGESLPLPPMTGGEKAAQIWGQRMFDLETRLNHRAKAADEKLKKNGVNADIRTTTGDGFSVDDVIGMHARYADLVMMQRHTDTSDAAAFNKRLCHGVLFQSGKPLLVYSDQPPEALTFNSIVVAWDGKLAASRALSAASPLLKTAGSVHVLCIDSENDQSGSDKDPGWDLSAYLARHQLKITLHNCGSDGQSISSVIQNRAAELGVDLIVMGAYGRSRLRERLFGGTTIEMLNHSGLPVLMAH